MAELVLGPALRHVDATSATVWVETDGACEVDVLGRRARTFQVGEQHFALVVVDGLEPDASIPYEVTLDDWIEQNAVGDFDHLLIGSSRRG